MLIISTRCHVGKSIFHIQMCGCSITMTLRCKLAVSQRSINEWNRLSGDCVTTINISVQEQDTIGEDRGLFRGATINPLTSLCWCLLRIVYARGLQGVPQFARSRMSSVTADVCLSPLLMSQSGRSSSFAPHLA